MALHRTKFLLHNTDGTASLEYLVVMLAFTLSTAAVLLTLGPGMLELFDARVFWLSLPLP